MNRRIGVIALAVACALLGTLGVYVYVGGADKRAVDSKRAVSVLMLVKNVPAGTSTADLKSGGFLREEHLPADSAPSSALSQIGPELDGEVTTTNLVAGQVFVREMLGSQVPTTSGLAIPKGMIAVSFKATTASDVAGYVQPGSEVALFDTFILGDGKNDYTGGSDCKSGDCATKLVLPRLTVLAVSVGAPTKTNEGIAGGGGDDLLVTVAVDQRQAERVIHVSQTGNPYLALLTDSSVVKNGGGVDNKGKLNPVFPDWEQ